MTKWIKSQPGDTWNLYVYTNTHQTTIYRCTLQLRSGSNHNLTTPWLQRKWCHMSSSPAVSPCTRTLAYGATCWRFSFNSHLAYVATICFFVATTITLTNITKIDVCVLQQQQRFLTLTLLDSTLGCKHTNIRIRPRVCFIWGTSSHVCDQRLSSRFWALHAYLHTYIYIYIYIYTYASIYAGITTHAHTVKVIDKENNIFS